MTKAINDTFLDIQRNFFFGFLRLFEIIVSHYSTSKSHFGALLLKKKIKQSRENTPRGVKYKNVNIPRQWE